MKKLSMQGNEGVDLYLKSKFTDLNESQTYIQHWAY